MRVHVFSPFSEKGCIEKVTRVLPLAEIKSRGSEHIVTQGRYQIRLTVEAWGPLDSIRSEVSISSTRLQEAGETSEEPLANIDNERLGKMVRLVIDTLQPPKDHRRGDRCVSSLGSL